MQRAVNEQEVCLQGLILDPMALRAVSSRAGKEGLMELLAPSGEKPHVLLRDFVHCSRHYSLAERVLALVVHERVGTSSERPCCSVDSGSWRALMESSLRCSLMRVSGWS